VRKGSKRRVENPEKLARRAIEDAGFEAHDANILFHSNCPNIDLVAYGRDRAVYVQVKSSRNPAGRDCIVVDGAPWTERQLYDKAPVYNKHDHFHARFVVLVDQKAAPPDFYVVPSDQLELAVRKRGRRIAKLPKRDGTKRSIGFRKELHKTDLRLWLDAWHLLGEPVRKPDNSAPEQESASRTPRKSSKLGKT